MIFTSFWFFLFFSSFQVHKSSILMSILWVKNDKCSSHKKHTWKINWTHRLICRIESQTHVSPANLLQIIILCFFFHLLIILLRTLHYTSGWLLVVIPSFFFTFIGIFNLHFNFTLSSTISLGKIFFFSRFISAHKFLVKFSRHEKLFFLCFRKIIQLTRQWHANTFFFLSLRLIDFSTFSFFLFFFCVLFRAGWLNFNFTVIIYWH